MNSLSYAYIFLQSNILELPVYLYFYLILFKSVKTYKYLTLVFTLSNLITHPIVFFILMSLKMSYIKSILVAELFAILGEMILHRWILKVQWPQAFLASLLANLFSWQMAPILTYFIFYQ